MNKYRYLIENVTVFAVGNVLSKIVSFFLLSLFTQYLTTSEYGDGELIVSTISLIMPILTLCVADAVMRYLLDSKDIKEIVTNGILVVLGGSILVVLLAPIALLIDTISKYYLCIAFLFISNSFEQLFFNINKGFENIKTCALNSLVSVLALVASSFYFLVYLNMGINGYLMSIITSHVACTIYLFNLGHIYAYFNFKSIDITLMKSMLAYSVPFIPSTIAWWFNSLSERYLIVFYLGNSFNGLFSVASKIPNIISIFTSIFHQAWTISGIKEFKDETYSFFYSNIYNFFSAFMFIGCSLLILIVPQIADLLFKGDFNEARLYVPFMIAGALFASLSGMLQPAFLAAKKTGKLMVSTVIGTLVNIIINVLFLAAYGLQVAAITTFVSFLVVWIIRWVMVRNIVRISINWYVFVLSTILMIIEIIFMIGRNNLYMLCLLSCGGIILINLLGIYSPSKKLYSLICAKIKNKLR